jgi:hypothetical protein
VWPQKRVMINELSAKEFSIREHQRTSDQKNKQRTFLMIQDCRTQLFFINKLNIFRENWVVVEAA